MITRQQADDLLSSGKFRPVRSRDEIPKLWWDGMGLEGMSDIGGPFSAGCTGPGAHKRVIAAAVSEPFAVLISEQGGIAYFATFAVFERKQRGVQCVYRETGVLEPRLSELLKKFAQ